MLERYEKFLSEERLDELRYRGNRLSDAKILTVNAAKDGGGVAQILKSLISLLRDVGIDIDWEVIEADELFFDITKRFHNGLQGENIELSDEEAQRYKDINHSFWTSVEHDYDFFLIHDPQPCALIDEITSKPAVIRLHIDLSTPNSTAWEFLQPYITAYDEAILSKQTYYHEDLSMDHRIIHPATDPFTPINEEMDHDQAQRMVQKRTGPTDHLITQVSRYDKWKDPVGVIDVFEAVRAKKQCSLLLLGSDAEDDPEGQEIYERVKERKAQSTYSDDITVVMENNAELVNAAQRVSDVIVQKSLREGFGLTVSEAMLKGTPVVASNVGGIPCQISHGDNGFLHEPRNHEAFAKTIHNLLDDREMKHLVGSRAVKSVKDDFLMTRLLDQYLSLFEDYLLTPGPV